MLMQEPFDHYTASCRKMSGPDTPSIHDCEMMDDKCKVGNRIFFERITYLVFRKSIKIKVNDSLILSI